MKAPAKLVCLESYWNERLFQTYSVKGFFEAMAPAATGMPVSIVQSGHTIVRAFVIGGAISFVGVALLRSREGQPDVEADQIAGRERRWTA